MQQPRVFVTTRDGDVRLQRQAPPPPCAVDSSLPALWVDATRRFQTLEGFGGAFTEAAAVTWQALPAEARDRFVVDCFDPRQGHGYTLGRVHMNSCDFALGHYAHVERPDDLRLDSFSIERDRQALLPFIRAALRVAGRPIKLLVSPWSPPAWMKTNGQMSEGGRLRPECRAAWAQCYVRFIRAYEAEGVPVWAVSVQNEPMARQRWDSCLYSAEEERDFVRDHLGPALHAAGLGHVKIVIWDHNRDLMVERASVVYGDARAAQYVWGTGFHWYGADHFDHVQLVHDAWPDKALLLRSFLRACDDGYAEGCVGASDIYSQDWENPLFDSGKALETARKACDMGSGEGCAVLPSREIAIADTEGTSEDAARWQGYRMKACKLGNMEACDNMLTEQLELR